MLFIIPDFLTLNIQYSFSLKPVIHYSLFSFHPRKRYTYNIHGDARIEGYHYCIPLETLLALNYNSFILTVGIIGVDSHARDMVIVNVHVYCWKYHPCIN